MEELGNVVDVKYYNNDVTSLVQSYFLNFQKAITISFHAPQNSEATLFIFVHAEK